jgi:hypothetical protein
MNMTYGNLTWLALALRGGRRVPRTRKLYTARLNLPFEASVGFRWARTEFITPRIYHWKRDRESQAVNRVRHQA